MKSILGRLILFGFVALIWANGGQSGAASISVEAANGWIYRGYSSDTVYTLILHPVSSGYEYTLQIGVQGTEYHYVDAGVLQMFDPDMLEVNEQMEIASVYGKVEDNRRTQVKVSLSDAVDDADSGQVSMSLVTNPRIREASNILGSHAQYEVLNSEGNIIMRTPLLELLP